MYQRFYTIENDTIKIHKEPQTGGITKEFEDKQEWQNFANLSRLKIVDGDIVAKTEAEMDAEAAAKITTAKPIEVLDALRALEYDDELIAMFQSNPELKLDWEVDDAIELDDPDVQAGLAAMGLDAEAVATLQLIILQARRQEG